MLVSHPSLMSIVSSSNLVFDSLSVMDQTMG